MGGGASVQGIALRKLVRERSSGRSSVAEHPRLVMLAHQTLARKALRCALYVQRFGFGEGSRNYTHTFLYGPLIRSRDPAAGCAVRARRGTSDLHAFFQVFVPRDYDFDSQGRSSRLIVDAGANAGYAAVYFAHRFPDATIVALEPARSSYELLVKNTKRYPRILPVNKALRYATARLEIVNPDDEKWLIQVVEADAGEPDGIVAISPSDVLALANADRIDLLKLDIEGSEREVFQQDVDPWLPKTRAIIIELHDWLRPGASRAFYSAPCRYGFDQYQRGREHFRPQGNILNRRAGAG